MTAGCLAAAALCLSLAGTGSALATPTASPTASPIPVLPTAVPSPSAPQSVGSATPTRGTDSQVPGGTDIQVPAGNAGPAARPAHGSFDWELAALLGAGAVFLGGAGIAVRRR